MSHFNAFSFSACVHANAAATTLAAIHDTDTIDMVAAGPAADDGFAYSPASTPALLAGVTTVAS